MALQPIYDFLTRETGYKGRGETLGAVVEAGGSEESADGHSRSNFVSDKGKAAIVIRQAWRERGRVGGEITDRKG